MKESTLTHIRSDGSATMVDVSHKPVVRRAAIAKGFIALQAETLRTIAVGHLPKGDVLATARIAGIQAAKKTWDLIPLCHQLPLSQVTIDFEMLPNGIEIFCQARTDAKTGVEMEALTGVTVAALTIYDMCKAIDSAMRISEVRLVDKQKQNLA